MKPWYKSKTVRFNAAALVGAITQVLPGLQGSIPPSWYPWLFAIFTIANLYLRKVTTQPIK